MAEVNIIEHLEIRNNDLILCFTCPNYRERIRECTQNLMINDERQDSVVHRQAFYGKTSDGVQFRKGLSFEDENSGWLFESEIKGWDAFFFENTDYPLHARTLRNDVKLLRLAIGNEQVQQVTAEDNLVFGSLNFHNQVGHTDIRVAYEKEGHEKCLSFTTEVLSYKMDYRTDMRSVIRDIEEEFSMLSYSFLKETYLTFSSSNRESTDLIWWQIFRDCFNNITEASRLIINNPKKRLQTSVRYERAERMPYMPPELENEYEEFKNEPTHLYRMEEMFLSKDTVENRFLKYALNSIADRFKQVRKNVLSILKADNLYIRDQISLMDDELMSLVNDPFFRGIGVFRGLSQESLVLKQAAGYRDIYLNWIILQCGYDLQEGVMQLEVKDISELYEIWCFIKIKNMVQHILRNKATVQTEGSKTEGNFVKSLIQGDKSEVVFFETDHPEIQLASIMYNATTDDEEKFSDESLSSVKTDIADTTSKTTEQRPDIVLRLSKTDNSIQYTYLFDAKYRIRDTTVPKRGGVEVPPVGAINQMHRYRDAIYYTHSSDEKLKREVVGGYVLYPGNLSKEQYENSYYQRSVDEVNIGAFPMKPGGQWKRMYKDDGSYNDILLDVTSSEDVLYHLIEKWLNDDNAHETLLKNAIPQKGLRYYVEKTDGIALVFMANFEDERNAFLNGRIGIPIRNSYNEKALLKNSSEIRYVLFHTRNRETGKHLFRTSGDVQVLFKDDAQKEGFYLIRHAESDLFICLELLLDNELDSSNISLSVDTVPYRNSKERFDSQYSTLKSLFTNISESQ